MKTRLAIIITIVLLLLGGLLVAQDTVTYYPRVYEYVPANILVSDIELSTYYYSTMEIWPLYANGEWDFNIYNEDGDGFVEGILNVNVIPYERIGYPDAVGYPWNYDDGAERDDEQRFIAFENSIENYWLNQGAGKLMAKYHVLRVLEGYGYNPNLPVDERPDKDLRDSIEAEASSMEGDLSDAEKEYIVINNKIEAFRNAAFTNESGSGGRLRGPDMQLHVESDVESEYYGQLVDNTGDLVESRYGEENIYYLLRVEFEIENTTNLESVPPIKLPANNTKVRFYDVVIDITTEVHNYMGGNFETVSRWYPTGENTGRATEIEYTFTGEFSKDFLKIRNASLYREETFADDPEMIEEEEIEYYEVATWNAVKDIEVEEVVVLDPYPVQEAPNDNVVEWIDWNGVKVEANVAEEGVELNPANISGSWDYTFMDETNATILTSDDTNKLTIEIEEDIPAEGARETIKYIVKDFRFVLGTDVNIISQLYPDYTGVLPTDNTSAIVITLNDEPLIKQDSNSGKWKLPESEAVLMFESEEATFPGIQIMIRGAFDELFNNMNGEYKFVEAES
jgi:hypothetical protein